MVVRRVAIIGPTHPFKGGIAQHTTVLARQLRDRGYDVRIVSWLHQYPQRLYPGVQTVDAPEFAPFEPTERSLSWNRPDSWLRAARSLRDVDLVVFAHVTPIQVPPYRTMAAVLRRAGVRVAVICHNVLPHEAGRFDEPLVRSLLSAADLVVVHSEQQRDVARGLTAAPIRVARLAPFMPEGFTRRAPRPGLHRRLLFFGLVRPYKGLDVLLRALAAGPPEVTLRVAGEFWGGTAAAWRLCEELGISRRVEITDGYLAADEVPKLFADVDAVVLPYRSATGSQAVWTGFEFGVPVVATRAGHLADDIRDGVDGLTVPADDAPALAAALRRLYETTPDGAVLVETMRARVRPVDPQPYWDAYVSALTAAPERAPQLAYSELQAKMLDEQHRRTKARKIVSVLHEHLGRRDLRGLTAVDVGCSAGFIAHELATDGARTIGLDIDEPGLAAARERFGDDVEFLTASGESMPFPDGSVDVIVFNHIYEHVTDPDAVLTEIHRVLKPTGVAYLGLMNRLGVIEPHYRLPFLSWLPANWADRYVRRSGRAEEYYERPLSRAGLKRLVRGFRVWDYTIPIVLRPDTFHSGDQITRPMTKVPAEVLRAGISLVPTYVWIATKSATPPATPKDAVPPELLDLTASPR